MGRSDRFNDLLRERGLALSMLGLADIALRREDALEAIEILGDDGVPILGGDVFFLQDDDVRLAYANWHTEKRPSEDDVAYRRRSCLETSNYIGSFPNRTGVIPLFVIVPKE